MRGSTAALCSIILYAGFGTYVVFRGITDLQNRNLTHTLEVIKLSFVSALYDSVKKNMF